MRLHTARGSNVETNTKLKRLHKSWRASCSLARVRTWVVGALPFLNHLLAYWKRYGDKLQNFEAEVYARDMRDGQQ